MKITAIVGTMICAYLFTILDLALITLADKLGCKLELAEAGSTG